MTEILIVDDHPLVSDGIKTMLKDADSISIEGACKTAAEAIQFLESKVEGYPSLSISIVK